MPFDSGDDGLSAGSCVNGSDSRSRCLDAVTGVLWSLPVDLADDARKLRWNGAINFGINFKLAFQIAQIDTPFGRLIPLPQFFVSALFTIRSNWQVIHVHSASVALALSGESRNSFGRCLAAERHAPSNHFVEHCTETPQVSPLIYVGALRLFR